MLTWYVRNSASRNNGANEQSVLHNDASVLRALHDFYHRSCFNVLPAGLNKLQPCSVPQIYRTAELLLAVC